MILTIDANAPDFNKKVNIFMSTVLKQAERQTVINTTDAIYDLYDNEYRKKFATAQIINEDPQVNEPRSLNAKVGVILRQNNINELELIAFSKEDAMTIKSQSLGTGYGISAEVLHKFNVGEPESDENQLSKWYMDPTYNLQNFMKQIKELTGNE
ncbi:MAG TPA: hypothetical protein PK705_07410 [Clostridia bacterium]|nr:hypothetical protein [Clostridia bacterium]